MGTACLEPLLYELFDRGVELERIVLVGTAGDTERRTLDEGAYWIDRAIAAASALPDGRVYEPSFDRGRLHALLSPASTVSTDFYYGLAPGAGQLREAIREVQPSLREALETTYRSADLVDMEVASFYALCRVLSRSTVRDVRFVAIKAPANSAAHQVEQNERTPRALRVAIEKAVALLRDD